MVMAVFGLVVSSLLATSGVAALGVEAQVALAQVTTGNSDTAAVALGQSTTLTEAQIQAVLGLLSSFNVDEATVSNVDAILHNTPAGLNGSTFQPRVASSTEHSFTGSSSFEASSSSFTATSSTPHASYPAASYSTNPCAVPTGVLGSGMYSNDVTLLQNFLVSQGYMASSSATAFFGTTTESALKQWQLAEGVVSSGDASSTGWGAFGPQTRSAMERICNPSSQPTQVRASAGIQDTRSFNGETGAASSSANTGALTPTCTLTSTQASSSPNTVKITWTSANATYASSPSGGKDSANGSRTVTINETTIFEKTVYGAGGSSTCYITVPVENADGSAPASKTPPTVQALAPADINLASVAVAAAQFPFAIAINSLTSIFVQLGVGQ